MIDAIDGHTTSVTISGRPLSNLRFADDIDGLAGSELIDLISRLDKSSRSSTQRKPRSWPTITQKALHKPPH